MLRRSLHSRACCNRYQFCHLCVLANVVQDVLKRVGEMVFAKWLTAESNRKLKIELSGVPLLMPTSRGGRK